MVRHSRLAMMVLVFTIVGLSWPSDAAAQRPRTSSRGAVSRPAPPGSAVTGVAVPRNYGHGGYYRPYYPSRYYPYYGRYYYPYYRPYYYAPFYYYPYYSNFAFGFGFSWGAPYWGGWGGYAYPYAYGYAYPYYGYAYDNTGSARLMITPRNAEVYVDGQFVGRVDDFDGSLQRLHVENGPHEIQIYLDGHRTFTQKVLFTRGTTLKIAHAMQPLMPGEAPEPKPAPAPAPEPDRYQQRQGPPPSRPGQAAEFGTLALRVNPPDAEVLIDGELWERPAGESRLSVDLPEGPHQIEIRKAGYRSYTRTVDVLRGRTFTLNVSLSQGGPGGTPVSVAYPPARRSGPR